jgi:hypothetical protein
VCEATLRDLQRRRTVTVSLKTTGGRLTLGTTSMHGKIDKIICDIESRRTFIADFVKVALTLVKGA